MQKTANRDKGKGVELPAPSVSTLGAGSQDMCISYQSMVVFVGQLCIANDLYEIYPLALLMGSALQDIYHKHTSNRCIWMTCAPIPLRDVSRDYFSLVTPATPPTRIIYKSHLCNKPIILALSLHL
jgi:hypothetical protein